MIICNEADQEKKEQIKKLQGLKKDKQIKGRNDLVNALNERVSYNRDKFMNKLKAGNVFFDIERITNQDLTKLIEISQNRSDRMKAGSKISAEIQTSQILYDKVYNRIKGKEIYAEAAKIGKEKENFISNTIQKQEKDEQLLKLLGKIRKEFKIETKKKSRLEEILHKKEQEKEGPEPPYFICVLKKALKKKILAKPEYLIKLKNYVDKRTLAEKRRDLEIEYNYKFKEERDKRKEEAKERLAILKQEIEIEKQKIFDEKKRDIAEKKRLRDLDKSRKSDELKILREKLLKEKKQQEELLYKQKEEQAKFLEKKRKEVDEMRNERENQKKKYEEKWNLKTTYRIRELPIIKEENKIIEDNAYDFNAISNKMKPVKSTLNLGECKANHPVSFETPVEEKDANSARTAKSLARSNKSNNKQENKPIGEENSNSPKKTALEKFFDLEIAQLSKTLTDYKENLEFSPYAVKKNQIDLMAGNDRFQMLKFGEKSKKVVREIEKKKDRLVDVKELMRFIQNRPKEKRQSLAEQLSQKKEEENKKDSNAKHKKVNSSCSLNTLSSYRNKKGSLYGKKGKSVDLDPSITGKEYDDTINLVKYELYKKDKNISKYLKLLNKTADERGFFKKFPALKDYALRIGALFAKNKQTKNNNEDQIEKKNIAVDNGNARDFARSMSESFLRYKKELERAIQDSKPQEKMQSSIMDQCIEYVMKINKEKRHVSTFNDPYSMKDGTNEMLKDIATILGDKKLSKEDINEQIDLYCDYTADMKERELYNYDKTSFRSTGIKSWRENRFIKRRIMEPGVEYSEEDNENNNEFINLNNLKGNNASAPDINTFKSKELIKSKTTYDGKPKGYEEFEEMKKKYGIYNKKNDELDPFVNNELFEKTIRANEN